VRSDPASQAVPEKARGFVKRVLVSANGLPAATQVATRTGPAL